MKKEAVNPSAGTLFEPFFIPHVGSFLWALSFVLIWLAILWVLYRRGIALRV